MDEKARLARNAYQRKYRASHKEQERKYRENYWRHVAEREQDKSDDTDDKKTVSK